jgi:hypothetical protein
MAILGGDERLIEAHDPAVKEALAELPGFSPVSGCKPCVPCTTLSHCSVWAWPYKPSFSAP